MPATDLLAFRARNGAPSSRQRLCLWNEIVSAAFCCQRLSGHPVIEAEIWIFKAIKITVLFRKRGIMSKFPVNDSGSRNRGIPAAEGHLVVDSTLRRAFRQIRERNTICNIIGDLLRIIHVGHELLVA